MINLDKTSIPYSKSLARSFRKDPQFAREYLNLVLREGSQKHILYAMRLIAKAFGIREVASASGLKPQTIYKALSDNGNPELKTFIAIIKALGFELSLANA